MDSFLVFYRHQYISQLSVVGINENHIRFKGRIPQGRREAPDIFSGFKAWECHILCQFRLFKKMTEEL